jgi:hypothetical protein
MRYSDYDDYEGYNYTSSIFTVYGRCSSMSVNIFIDIEKEILLYERDNKSIEEYIESICSNDKLNEVAKALSEVIDTKFPQYSIYLH